MLNSADFDISPKCSFEFKDALRNLVEELGENESLFSQTLKEYLNELGEILFLEEDGDETRVVRFMAPISDYLINEEFRYSLQDEEDLESDV